MGWAPAHNAFDELVAFRGSLIAPIPGVMAEREGRCGHEIQLLPAVFATARNA